VDRLHSGRQRERSGCSLSAWFVVPRFGSAKMASKTVSIRRSILSVQTFVFEIVIFPEPGAQGYMRTQGVPQVMRRTWCSGTCSPADTSPVYPFRMGTCFSPLRPTTSAAARSLQRLWCRATADRPVTLLSVPSCTHRRRGVVCGQRAAANARFECRPVGGLPVGRRLAAMLR
jgi:hypothetical protein